MPGPGRHLSYQKPQNAGKALARILGYLLRQRGLLILAACFVLLSAGAGVAGTYFLKPLINDCIVPLIGRSPQAADLRPLVRMLVLLGTIYLTGVLSTYLYSRLMVQVSNRTLNLIRKDLFDKMQDLPIRYYDTHTHGDLMSRYTNDVDTVREAIGNGVAQLMTSAVTVAGAFIMMLILSPLLTLLIVVMLLVMFRIVKLIGRRSAVNFKRQQQAVGAANGFIEEMIEGQKVIKVFSHEAAATADFSALNEQLRQASTRAHSYANAMMPIMGNLSYLNYALTAAAGAMLVIGGRIDIGSIASFLQYTRSFSQPITQISQQFNALLAALAGAERIFAVIDEPPEQDEGFVTLVNVTADQDGVLKESASRTDLWAWKDPRRDAASVYTRLLGDVRFCDVNFGYEPGEPVLRDVSLTARPGQKIALVGSTGAGKTTITNLLNRFYDVPDGKIRYDGINIGKIKKEDLRRSLAMVLQDTHLFTGTVRENIRYGKLDATDEDVEAAARLTNAHSFIRHLPHGYDTWLYSDGANLSQGQRQLIANARAAVADPPVLVLDEATSSIDTRTEALIAKGLDELMNGRTVFIIAHRLSTVRNADVILVMEKGEIAESGSHEELMARQGRYYQLYTGQFELA